MMLYREGDTKHAAKKLTEMKLSKGYEYLEKMNNGNGGKNGRNFEDQGQDQGTSKRGPLGMFDDTTTKQIKRDNYSNRTSSVEMEEEKQSNRNKTSADSLPVKFPMTKQLWEDAEEIEKHGLSIGLICEVTREHIIVLGIPEKVEAFRIYLNRKEKMNERLADIKTKEDEERRKREERQKREEDNSNEFAQNEVELSSELKSQRNIIENKLKEMGLFYEIHGNKLAVLGPHKAFRVLKEFLAKLEKNQDRGSESPAERSPEVQSSDRLLKMKINGMYFQIEISNIDPKMMGQIKSKGNLLGIKANYHHDRMVLSGPFQQRDENFVIYLEEMNSDVIENLRRKKGESVSDGTVVPKKSLYPQCWDFDEKSPFAQLRVKQGTREYDIISKLFGNAGQIVRMERVQNKYLMDNYVSYLQTKLDSPHFRREILFQSLGDQIRENLNSGITKWGTTLDYFATYHEGLYYSGQAIDVIEDHQEVMAPNGNFLIYLADVYIGNCTGQEVELTPDSKYDTSMNGNLFVVNNQFQSCPLYIIEYTMD